MSDDILNDKLLKRLLGLIVLYQVVALLLVGGWTYYTFNKEEWTILWVPQSVLSWSLLGAVGGVLHRLASYPRLSSAERAELYLWSIVKPFLGTAFGGIIYFLTSAGVLVLKSDATITNTQLLCAIAFVAAFSDRFSLGVIEKITKTEISLQTKAKTREKAAPKPH